MSIRNYLQEAVPEERIQLLEQVQKYYLEQLPTFNFTAHRSVEDFEILNILDSILPFIQNPQFLQETSTVLDIGTGGGFPGVPLAILFPEIQFTLSDSIGKKMQLIQTIVDLFALKNISIMPGRFEELARQTSMRESYDVVLSRAVAKWTTLLEYALPFVKIGGIFFAYQGEAVLNELSASHDTISLLGGAYRDTYRYSLPMQKGERYIIATEKVAHTPDLYPRATGIPKKTPLSL